MDETGRKPQIVGFADGAAVTPSDSVDLPHYSSALWISVAGNVKFTTIKGATLTCSNVPVGWFQCRARRVWSTGTTATVENAVWE